MVAQHEARPEQGLGSRFEMTGDPVDEMKMSAIHVRVDESHGDRTFVLIRLVLDRDHLIDGPEELLHVLARALAMDIFRRADRALKGLRAVDEEISQPKKRCRQFQVRRPSRKEPRQECRIFEIIGRVVGDFQDHPAEDLCSGNASNGQTGLLDDVIGAAVRQLCPRRVPRQCVLARGCLLAQGCAQAASELDDDAGVTAGIRQEALLGRPEMVEELGPHLVANKCCRLPFEQSTFDRSVGESVSDGHGNFHIPGAHRLAAVLDDAMKAMLAPLTLLASDSKEAAALHGQYRQRSDQLFKARLTIVDDMISGETIASMTSGRPPSGDGFHILIMHLHKEINRLQSEISTEVIEGAKAYGVTEADRSLITAFMTGVNRTAPLKFDHPGLATTVAHSGNTLLIQNDLGTTDAHVIVARIAETSAVVTHTDVHVRRLRFFQSLLVETGIQWDELRSHQGSVIAKGDLFYVGRGRPEHRGTW